MLLGYPFLAAMGHPLYTNYTVMTTSMVHITGLAILYVCGMIAPITVAMMVVVSETLLSFSVFGGYVGSGYSERKKLRQI